MVHAAVIPTTSAKINFLGEFRELVCISFYVSIYLWRQSSSSTLKEINFMLLNACEIFLDGLPKQFRTSQGLKCLYPTGGARIRHFSKYVPKRIKELSNPVVDSFFVWNRILTAHTSCCLTRDEDKLVAISATARRVQPLVQGTYLGDFWSRYLPYHLFQNVWPPKRLVS
jgi:hypothetical protein